MQKMSWDFILFIPLVYSLYAFLRLAVDRAIVSKKYDEIVAICPFVKSRMADPCAMKGAWKWMNGNDPDWTLTNPHLLENYREIRQRLRAWNYHRFPIAVVLSVICGITRELMKR